jgi:hypothetical protein
MAYSLRLPDTLDAAARAKADYLGISLNAFVCVALDAYLRVPSETAPARAEPTIAIRIPTTRSVREKAVDDTAPDTEPEPTAAPNRALRRQQQRRARKQ